VERAARGRAEQGLAGSVAGVRGGKPPSSARGEERGVARCAGRRQEGGGERQRAGRKKREGREEEEGKKKKKMEKRKEKKMGKREREREKGRAGFAPIAAPTATARARALVRRGAAVGGL